MHSFRLKHHIVDTFFTLALFCVFTISALIVMAIGVNVYQNTTKSSTEHYNLRTSFSYITEKIRQADANGAISIGKVGAVNALCLSQTIEGTAYVTYIYPHENELKELFAKADTDVDPSMGTTITPLQGFDLTPTSNGMYQMTCHAKSGIYFRMILHPVSSEWRASP